MSLNLESRTVVVSKSPQEVFSFLSTLSNYEQLMPESTEKFQIDGDSFVFALKGMPEIRLVLKETVPNKSIVLGAASSKMPFTLTSSIEEEAGSSKIHLTFQGDFNPMMRMMVTKPLTHFINTLIDNIEKI
ncbi:SRPBCC family protein [Flavicella sp.]|nr:SRPBCC family protein [Flavicella sp.]